VEFLSRSRLFETTDPEAGQEFAGRIWEKNQTFLRADRYGLRWNQVDLEASALSYIEVDHPVDLIAQGPLSDHFRLFFHRGGAISHQLDGRSLVSDVETSVIHAPGENLKLTIEPFQLLLVSLPGDFVRSSLSQRFKKMPPPSSWLGDIKDSPCVQTLRSTAEWLCAELDRPNSPLARPGKPRRHAERMLLSLFMECLAEAAPAEADPILGISEAQVRRAEEWIAAHISEPIGLEEVSSALGIGLRSLERAFQRARGCSPRQAIFRQRLERVREALLRAGPGDTVTSIAAEYGFLELGRFSMRYRQQFGEAPSQTLARRRNPSGSVVTL
jgi:AraC-like DNA-binding protein